VSQQRQPGRAQQEHGVPALPDHAVTPLVPVDQRPSPRGAKLVAPADGRDEKRKPALRGLSRLLQLLGQARQIPGGIERDRPHLQALDGAGLKPAHDLAEDVRGFSADEVQLEPLA
jgi:hypothetical protein